MKRQVLSLQSWHIQVMPLYYDLCQWIKRCSNVCVMFRLNALFFNSSHPKLNVNVLFYFYFFFFKCTYSIYRIRNFILFITFLCKIVYYIVPPWLLRLFLLQLLHLSPYFQFWFKSDNKSCSQLTMFSTVNLIYIKEIIHA